MQVGVGDGEVTQHPGEAGQDEEAPERESGRHGHGRVTPPARFGRPPACTWEFQSLEGQGGGTRLEAEIERAKRFGSPLALVLFNLDHFKAVNDTHGQTYGDRSLAAVVDRASTIVRRIGTLARFGGDEFAVLLPSTDLDGAYRVAERLQRAVNDSDVTRQIGITLSLGVAEYRSGEDADALLSRADRALYDAKHAGRDRVSVPRVDTGSALAPTGGATPE